MKFYGVPLISMELAQSFGQSKSFLLRLSSAQTSLSRFMLAEQLANSAPTYRNRFVASVRRRVAINLPQQPVPIELDFVYPTGH